MVNSDMPLNKVNIRISYNVVIKWSHQDNLDFKELPPIQVILKNNRHVGFNL